MKIGIDARLWGTQHAGIGRYTEELVTNLQKIDKKNEYVVFCRKKDFESIPGAKLWKKVIADVPHYTFREQTVLPRIFLNENLDLLHVTHFNAPIFYPKPFVVTIHDILWHQVRGRDVTTQPSPIYAIKYAGYKIAVKNAVTRAKKIIVPSKAVKKDLVNSLHLNEEKIKVVYEGVTTQKARSKSNRTSYLLYVGNLYPHKNVETLVRTLKHLSLNLVIVCGRSVFWDRFKRFIEKEKAEDFVKLVGYVTDEELAGLYKNAQAFVFPTLSEGFGLPGLEAMAYGTPVVCSDIPVLREIYGDAALYFNPKDAQDIADKIQKILTDKLTRLNLVKAGKKQVKKYSWLKMAKETLKVYEEILDE